MHIPGIKIAVPVECGRRVRPHAHRAPRQQPRPLRRERPSLRPPRQRSTRPATPIPFGQARIAREGSDATVVALSGMVDEALDRRRPARGAGHLGRGDRPAHARAARHGDDPRLAAQDDAARRRPRRAPDARLRRRDRGAVHGGGVRLPRRAGRAGRLQGRADPVHAERASRRSTRARTTSSLPSSVSSHDRRDRAAALHLDGGRQGQPVARRRTATSVSAGQPVVEVETDKATVEIEAPGRRSAPDRRRRGSDRGRRGRARARSSRRPPPSLARRRRAPSAACRAADGRPARGSGPRARGGERACRPRRADRLACGAAPRPRAGGRRSLHCRAPGPGGRIVARDVAAPAADPAAPAGAGADRVREAVVAEHHRELAADPARPHRRRARRRRPRARASRRRPTAPT